MTAYSKEKGRSIDAARRRAFDAQGKAAFGHYRDKLLQVGPDTMPWEKLSQSERDIWIGVVNIGSDAFLEAFGEVVQEVVT
jgi:hypothetical protein